MHESLLLLLAAVAGAVGALLRYGVSRLFDRYGWPAHYATLTVNLIGASLLGFLAGGAAVLDPDMPYVLLGGSLLGGLTTFSTLMLQLAGFAERRTHRKLYVYMAQTFVIGIPLAGIGYWAGAWLAGG